MKGSHGRPKQPAAPSTTPAPASPTPQATGIITNKTRSKFFTVPKTTAPISPSLPSPATSQAMANISASSQTASAASAASGVSTSSNNAASAPVNRKKQKRREKANAKAAAEHGPNTPDVSHGLPSPPNEPHPAEGDVDGNNVDENNVENGLHADGEQTNGDSLHDAHTQNGLADAALSNAKKAKKKKKKGGADPLETASSYDTSQGHPARSGTPVPAAATAQAPQAQRSGMSKEKIWNTSSQEERERIKAFWLSLGERERKDLVKVEKDAVLRKMKDQQKHSCSCAVCGRKRNAIEEELEGLYDAYYEELEQYANHPGRGEGPPMMAPGRSSSSSMSGVAQGRGVGSTSSNQQQQPSHPRVAEQTSADEGDEADEEYTGDDQDEEYEAYSEAPSEGLQEADYGQDFLSFGSHLTVQGGILTVADDLLKNDGKKFIEMMEQLAERRLAREEEARAQFDPRNYAHSNGGDRYGSSSHTQPLPPEDEDYEDEVDEEYEDDEYDEESGVEEAEVLNEDQRMEEGRRMFQIFAARMFEQRVLTAYREKVAKERQDKLIEELELENKQELMRKDKKARNAQKRKDKLAKKKEAQAKENARKEEEQLREEQARQEEETRKQEEQQREQQRKAEEKKKKLRELRQQEMQKKREQLLERQARDAAAREAKELQRRERAQKEQQEAREKEQQAQEKEAAEAKAKAERAAASEEAKAKESKRSAREEKAAKKATAASAAAASTIALPKRPAAETAAAVLTTVPAVPAVPAAPVMPAMPLNAVPIPVPALLQQPSLVTAQASPTVHVATPALPKAPTPLRVRQTSHHQGTAVSHGGGSGGSAQSQGQPPPLTSVPPIGIPKALNSAVVGPQLGMAQQRSSSSHSASPIAPTAKPSLPMPVSQSVSQSASQSIPTTQPHPNTFHMPPLGPLPSFPSAIQQVPPGFPTPAFPSASSASFRAPQPGMMAIPPGMNGPMVGRGFPVGPPPGFSASMESSLAPLAQPFIPSMAKEAAPLLHSRQTSSSGYESLSSQQQQPIGRPAPIGRPSNPGIPGQRSASGAGSSPGGGNRGGLALATPLGTGPGPGPGPGPDLDSSAHLGSSALLEDSSGEPLQASTPSVGPRPMQQPFPALPFGGMDPMFPSSRNPWQQKAGRSPFDSSSGPVPPPGFGSMHTSPISSTPWGSPVPLVNPLGSSFGPVGMGLTGPPHHQIGVPGGLDHGTRQHIGQSSVAMRKNLRRACEDLVAIRKFSNAYSTRPEARAGADGNEAEDASPRAGSSRSPGGSGGLSASGDMDDDDAEARFIPLDEVKIQLQRLGITIDNQALLDMCETEGNDTNGGGAFDVRHAKAPDGSDSILIRYVPDMVTGPGGSSVHGNKTGSQGLAPARPMPRATSS